VRKSGALKKGEPARRVLIIVSRDAPELYGHLTYAFKGNHAVRVILDRRRHAIPIVRADRRSVSVETALRTLGWAVVRYPIENMDVFYYVPVPEVAAARV
jgi:hypothetical protein